MNVFFVLYFIKMIYGKLIMCLLYVVCKYMVKWIDKFDLLNGLQCICKYIILWNRYLKM